ncbi:glycosyltransferase family 25 protein [Rhexocercosporidium sp. MPI-PUGE-AT-0058]|nr:glycosyltransferase family 25 protein [Rhexocercosporidium sp. MPI-PUGE-AT-0058]
MIGPRTSPYLFIACAVATILLLVSLRRHATAASPSSNWALSNQPTRTKNNFRSATANKKIDTTSEIGRASNKTLGFQKIFVLGLPERSDKKDAIVLSASLTGFEVEFFDAVRGDQVLDKTRPPGLNLKDGALGTWRSHLNVIRSIIENNLASAFIMEDDADWDIRLLSQLPDFAKGIRYLSGISSSEAQHSPYGDDWDILWPGHCGDVPPKDDDRRYTIENDQTVAPKAHQPWLKGLKDLPESTRIVHKAGAPMCTFGYAVSYRGAQKILMALAIKAGENLAIDNGMAYLCRDGFLDMKCYSVEPQLFQHHRPAGLVSKDSDINIGTSDAVRQKGVTDFIVLSARLNLEQMILGSENYVTQW